MGLGELYQLHKLMKNQWLKTSQIEEIQQRKLRKLLKHAYNNVPYYRQLFDSAGVKPGEIKTVDDLPRIPVTTKEHLRNLPFDQVIAKGININKCVKRRTSGSTGIPMDSFVTKKDFSFRPLLDFRILYSNGYKWSDKILTFILREPQKRWFQHLGIMRRKYISILDSVEEQIENIQRINPDII